MVNHANVFNKGCYLTVFVKRIELFENIITAARAAVISILNVIIHGG